MIENKINSYDNTNINHFYENEFQKIFQNINHLNNALINKNNNNGINLNINIYNGINNINNYINIVNNKDKNYFNNINFTPSPTTNQNINNKIEPNDDTLTQILCTRFGMRQMRKFFNENTLATDYITNIILLLKKEKGLMTVFNNKYGNYFIQDLIRKMNKEQIQLLLDLICQNFATIAENCSGTHCIQKLLNHVTTQNIENTILNSIKKKEFEMAHNKNATYVLQKILLVIADTKRTNLNEVIIENILEFSLYMNSSYVVKRFMETTTIIENMEKIIEIFAKNCIKISQNPFGNYVIQYAFDVFDMKDCNILVKKIINKASILVCQKFSVNVIEKVWDLFDENRKNKLITSLCNNENVLLLANSQFGSRILYKISDYKKNEIKKILIDNCGYNLNNVYLNDNIKSNKFIMLLKEKK